jgi:2-keto-4-pentenoate hydratase
VQVPSRLVAALAAQHERRRTVLSDGAHPVGWKVGLGKRERVEGVQPVGFLTSDTLLEDGGRFAAEHAGRLCADAEIAVRLAEDVDAEIDPDGAAAAIDCHAPAIELVDLAGTDEPVSIVAGNLWHRAFALGSARPPTADVETRLVVNGEARAAGRSAPALGERVAHVARLLATVDAPLQAGDWIITGGVVQVAVRPGDEVVAEFHGLGRVALMIT